MKNKWAIKQTGFTIVELLIVIVVIAVLAAITIVAYNGIQNRAYDSAIQSDLSTIAKKLEAYKLTSANDQYPTTLATAGVDISVSKSSYGNHYLGLHNLLYCRMASGQAYAVAARSNGGTTYAITNAKSVYVSSQVLTTAGTQCPAEGMSGAAPSWTYSNGAWTI